MMETVLSIMCSLISVLSLVTMVPSVLAVQIYLIEYECIKSGKVSSPDHFAELVSIAALCVLDIEDKCSIRQA